MLTIATRPVASTEWHYYAIRFCQTGDTAVPALYYQGKRVTQAWRIELVAESAEDKTGESANTA
jgi:hypothetical protein